MIKIRHVFFILVAFFLLLSSHAYAAKLANYFGTGHHPKLVLELSANGAGWQPFSIDYQQVGDVPGSRNTEKNWSTWNTKDENGNFYGTITLHSDNNIITWGNYVAGTEGYYLEGIHFSQSPTIDTYQLTVDKIHENLSPGPFPNTPLAQPATFSDGTKIMLSVKENTIVNNMGKTITLKGIVRPSLEWNPQGQFLSPQDIQIMHNQWGANAIRIDLNQNYWFASADKSTIGSYKQIIDAIIYCATQNHMAVILDLHWTENGHQSSMANKNSILFWKEIANEYKNFGTVIFELFNEPVNIDPATWLKGNSTYAGYQELYDAVRSTGAENICIMNGLDYGYDLSFVNNNFRVNGYNIVYGSHPYNAKGSDGGFDRNFKGVLGKYPLIFTEFGSNDPADFPSNYAVIYKRILDYTQKAQVNYTAFAWWVQPDNPAFPAVIADWQGTPLNGGVLIKNDMRSSPSTPIDAK